MIKTLQQTIGIYPLMENSVLAKSMRTLTAITAGLNGLSLSSKFVIPDIVVAGSRCGGKSSTIEKLIGFEYLPREYNTDTQRIQFHFIYTPNLTLPYAQIVEQINKGSIIKYVDFDKLRDHINKLTVPSWGNSSPSTPIIIKIYSSFMPNLTIIDLPGYSRIVINASYQQWLKQIRNMIESQIAKPGSILLGVIGANTDYIGCDILRMMRLRDPKGFRSLAAVTKVDIMDRGTNALSILKNQEIALRNGYIGIKNRSSQSRKSTSIEQALIEQEKFFKNSKFYKDLPRELWGTESLSLKLVDIIYEQTMKQLKNITQYIKQQKTGINTQPLIIRTFLEGKSQSELKTKLEQLEFLQKLINEDPFFAKILNNQKQNPQDYNEIVENVKPVEMMRPRKNDFDSFFKSPPVRIVTPTPPKPKIFANSEERQADERKKKPSFLRLFGI